MEPNPLPPALTILSTAPRREGAPRKRKQLGAGDHRERDGAGRASGPVGRWACSAPSPWEESGAAAPGGGRGGAAEEWGCGGYAAGECQGLTGVGGLWDEQGVGRGEQGQAASGNVALPPARLTARTPAPAPALRSGPRVPAPRPGLPSPSVQGRPWLRPEPRRPHRGGLAASRRKHSCCF